MRSAHSAEIESSLGTVKGEDRAVERSPSTTRLSKKRDVLEPPQSSSRTVRPFVTFAKAGPKGPAFFFVRSSREASIKVHPSRACRHKTWTESVTGGSRLHSFVRLLSRYARSVRSPTSTGNEACGRPVRRL